MRIYGLDISLDHGGFVLLDEVGKVLNYAYITSTKKSADIDPEHSILLSKIGKGELKETFRLRRMGEYQEGLLNFLHPNDPPPQFMAGQDYYCVEGYSYASQTTSICQIAELTGYLKQTIFENCGKIRIHDPLSVKLFATNQGNCMKKDVVIKARVTLTIPEGLIQKKMIKKKKLLAPIEEYDGPATDIADAYFLAKMLQMELAVRSGTISMSQLSESERRIFLRVTKSFPVNLLARDFVYKL